MRQAGDDESNQANGLRAAHPGVLYGTLRVPDHQFNLNIGHRLEVRQVRLIPVAANSLKENASIASPARSVRSSYVRAAIDSQLVSFSCNGKSFHPIDPVATVALTTVNADLASAAH